MEEAWKMFEKSGAFNTDAKIKTAIRGIFMCGGYAAVGVLSNRLSELPGTTDPGEMVKALINTIQVAFAELEMKANDGMENKTFGRSQ